MKLSSSLLIAVVAANNSEYEKAQSVEHWHAIPGETCNEQRSGYAPGRCGNGNWCCHGDLPNDCPDNVVKDLKKDFVYKSAIRQNEAQQWWCMQPRGRRSAAENAKIDKCLKNYSGKTYESKHGRIGFFFRTLSNIAKDYIDAPAYQCHSITTSKEIFLSFLRLRKTCQKKTNEWKKKTGNNFENWDDWVEEKKERKAENADKKRQRKQNKKQNRTRRDEFDDEDLAFVDDGSEELNSLFDSLEQIESGNFSDEDIRAAIEADCTGQEIEDEDYCASLAAALQGERSVEDQQNMEILVKMSKARKGIRIWGHTFIPSGPHAHCNKKRNRLIAKTRFNVRRLMDMRRNHKSSPDKNAAKAKGRRQRLQRKSDREVAKETLERTRADNRLKQIVRAQQKAERDEQKAENEAKAAARAAKKAESTAVAEA